MTTSSSSVNFNIQPAFLSAVSISQNFGYDYARFILVATKVDTEMERAVSEVEIKSYAQEYNIDYIETLAKRGLGIEELTNAIALLHQKSSENKAVVRQEKPSCLVM